MTAPFDITDLAQLLALYIAPDGRDQQRRPPWTWAALDRVERAALARLIDTFVTTYNQMHALTEDELIPPCWRRHPALAAELAVQLWCWYAAHLDPRATPLVAAEYYGRHLPAFRGRLDRLLGRSPAECRQGQHPVTWRKDADEALQILSGTTHDPLADRRDVMLFGELHFSFGHLNDAGQR